MKYQILRTEPTAHGKILAWVDLGNGDVQIFKLKPTPNPDYVRYLVDSYLVLRNYEQQKQEMQEAYLASLKPPEPPPPKLAIAPPMTLEEIKTDEQATK